MVCIHVNEITLYINCVFYSGLIRTLVAVAAMTAYISID